MFVTKQNTKNAIASVLDIPFNFEGSSIRILTHTQTGEPWFLAKDVAEVLGYRDTDQAIRRHCKMYQTCPVESTGQLRRVLIIPEADLYRLVLKSTLPAAERFESWVMEEVLPQIRQNGSYGTVPALPDFSNPVIAARAWADAKEGEMQALAFVEEAKSKVEAFDAFMNSEGTASFTDVAKVLGVGPNIMTAFLVAENVLYRDKQGILIPISRYAGQKGLFNVIFKQPEKGRIRKQTMVTPRGADAIRDMVNENPARLVSMKAARGVC